MYMYNGLYGLPGSSGSALYNIKDEVIDTGASSGIGAYNSIVTGCTDFYTSASNTTNGPTVDVSSQIPRSEILISPIVDVSHIGDVGGPLSNAVSSYSVAAVPGGSAVYSVSPVAGTEPGGPSLVTNPGPGSYLSIPVNSPPITITASSAGVSSCGIWDYTVNVRDVSNDQNNYLRHHFEIGMKEIEVGPDSRWDAAIFGSSVPASKFFEIRNLRPTATVVRARLSGVSVPVSQSTFLVDGARDSVFTLQPEGQAGDSKSLEISVNGSGSLPAPGTTYNDGVVIEITDTSCALTDPISIPLSLRLGFQEFSKPASGAEVQSPSTANPQGTSEVIDFVASGTNGWCASQPQLEIGFLPMVGVDPPAPQLPAIASVLDVKLRSPDGTQAHLWDSNSISPQVVGAYVSNEPTTLEGYQIVGQVLRMNGGFSPALGPDSINLFNGKSVTGTWRLEIRKSANNGIVRPYRAKLKFNGTSCTP